MAAMTGPFWILLEQAMLEVTAVMANQITMTTTTPNTSEILQAGCPSCHPTDSAEGTFLCVDMENKSEGSAAEEHGSEESIFLGFESVASGEKSEAGGQHPVEGEEPREGGEGGSDEGEEMSAASHGSESSTKSASETVSTVYTVDPEPSVELLWSFQCSLTNGYNVTSIDWSKSNRVCIKGVIARYNVRVRNDGLDLLAVGYCLYSYNTPNSGIVCCWSLKNVEYPERSYILDVGVTSVAFCVCRPNLLAVGMLDGVIAVYNVNSSETYPLFDTVRVDGRHVGPVWQLEWVVVQHTQVTVSDDVIEEYDESLVSVSGDGRVVQWVIRKEFKGYTIQKLRRPAAKMTAEIRLKPGGARVSEDSAGMCLSFSTVDKNMYLVGTEDGYIHRCLCTHTEQYISTYKGHMGPVYAVQWSPFNGNVFLSSSTDWDIKIWHQTSPHHAISLTSPLKSANCACWSPFSETLLASINEDSLYIWDLARNSVDPTVVQTSAAGVKLHCVQFAFNANSVLTGDGDGAVAVYYLHGLDQHTDHQGQNLEFLVQAAMASSNE